MGGHLVQRLPALPDDGGVDLGRGQVGGGDALGQPGGRRDGEGVGGGADPVILTAATDNGPPAAARGRPARTVSAAT